MWSLGVFCIFSRIVTIVYCFKLFSAVIFCLKNGKICSNGYIYFGITVYTSLNILLALMFICRRKKSNVAKLTALQMSHCTESEITFPCTSLNIFHLKNISAINRRSRSIFYVIYIQAFISVDSSISIIY